MPLAPLVEATFSVFADAATQPVSLTFEPSLSCEPFAATETKSTCPELRSAAFAGVDPSPTARLRGRRRRCLPVRLGGVRCA